MSLELKINGDIKTAMLARDAEKLEALRAIKAALLLEKAREGATGEIGDEVELKILQKLVKQRRESADIYSQANRQDLAKKELYDASVIETYLPRQMSEAEVTEIIKKIVAETGATSVKDMGKVMGAAAKELAGKADNKMISVIVKSLLTT
ncbi:MAG: GatB/YqeY domain-containing protein [Bacteroidetes bacterium]|nr:GatB/YqeY domain-containing protein [Bacteroidota bacterium]